MFLDCVGVLFWAGVKTVESHVYFYLCCVYYYSQWRMALCVIGTKSLASLVWKSGVWGPPMIRWKCWGLSAASGSLSLSFNETLHERALKQPTGIRHRGNKSWHGGTKIKVVNNKQEAQQNFPGSLIHDFHIRVSHVWAWSQVLLHEHDEMAF